MQSFPLCVVGLAVVSTIDPTLGDRLAYACSQLLYAMLIMVISPLKPVILMGVLVLIALVFFRVVICPPPPGQCRWR